MDDAEWALRCDLAAAYRLAAHYGWDDGISTHFSLRLPGPDHSFLINPFGSLFDEITASALIKVDLDGHVLSPAGRVNKAGFTIHGGIHAARADAVCIMHCHTVAGIGVGAQKAGLLPLSGHAMTLYGRVGYHHLEGSAVDPSEVPRFVTDLGDNDVLMLRNHGTLAIGPDVGTCFLRLYFLERACEMQIAAQTGGGELVIPLEAIGPHMQDQIRDSFPDLAALNWAAMLRLAARIAPDYLQ
jgi:ribulose-5-phosphate 4-epimerase/fuculose-1-phosphate aldolase